MPARISHIQTNFARTLEGEAHYFALGDEAVKALRPMAELALDSHTTEAGTDWQGAWDALIAMTRDTEQGEAILPGTRGREAAIAAGLVTKGRRRTRVEKDADDLAAYLAAMAERDAYVWTTADDMASVRAEVKRRGLSVKGAKSRLVDAITADQSKDATA